MSGWKHLFSRALAAAPGRLHLAAHSHHLWPDVSFDAQVEAWQDAAALADLKWKKVMGELWPIAQREVSTELGLPDPNTIVFAPNTHELVVRLVSAAERRPLRLLTSSGEFHSLRRQAARWAEAGTAVLETVDAGLPEFSRRFVERAAQGGFDIVFVSHVMFETGQLFDCIERLADLAHPQGPWIVIDGYHAFMAIETDLAAVADRIFYLGGGYKYAMAGEGAAFLHAPADFGPRPEITGWYAEFAGLDVSPARPGYEADARRFLGATFDPSGLYRFIAVRRMLAGEGLSTGAINDHVAPLRERLLAGLGQTPLADAHLLNPGRENRRARFLAFKSASARHWQEWLLARGIVTDVRGEVLRIGLGLYHDEWDIDRFVETVAQLPVP